MGVNRFVQVGVSSQGGWNCNKIFYVLIELTFASQEGNTRMICNQ